MKTKNSLRTTLVIAMVGLATVTGSIHIAPSAFASGSSGGGGGGVRVDSIKVSKCYYDAPTGQMLIKASSSDVTARLYAYRPDGTYQGEVQNGGGSRYGGTVMGYIPYDPGTMTIISSSGGGLVVPTTPFII